MACGGDCGCDDCRAATPSGSPSVGGVAPRGGDGRGARGRARRRRVAVAPEGSDGAVFDDALHEPDPFFAERSGLEHATVSPPQTVEPRPDPVQLPAWLLAAMQDRAEADAADAEGADVVTSGAVSPAAAVETADDGGDARPSGLPAPRAHFDEATPQQRGKGGGGDGRQRFVSPGGGIGARGTAPVAPGDPAAAVRVMAPDWAIVDLSALGPLGRPFPGWDGEAPSASSGPVTTPSSPPAVDGRVCPCDCVCVPAPASGEAFALLPGYGASGPDFLAPPLMIVDAARASQLTTTVAATPGSTPGGGASALASRRTASGDATPTSALAASLSGAFAAGIATSAVPGSPTGGSATDAAGRTARSTASGQRGASLAGSGGDEPLADGAPAPSRPDGVSSGVVGDAAGSGLASGLLGAKARGLLSDATPSAPSSGPARAGGGPDAERDEVGDGRPGGDGAASRRDDGRGERGAGKGDDGKGGDGKGGADDRRGGGGGGGGRWSGPSGPRGDDLSKPASPIAPPTPTSPRPVGATPLSPPLHPSGSPGTALRVAADVLASSAATLRVGDRSPRAAVSPPRHPALAPGGAIRTPVAREARPVGSAPAGPAVSPSRAWELEHLMGGGDPRSTPSEDAFASREASRPRPPVGATSAERSPSGAGSAASAAVVPDGASYAGAKVRAVVPGGGGVRGIVPAATSAGPASRGLVPGGSAPGADRAPSVARPRARVAASPRPGMGPVSEPSPRPTGPRSRAASAEAASGGAGATTPDAPRGALRPGGVDVAAADDTGVARGRGGATLSAAANAGLVADGLASEARSARRSAMERGARLDAVEEARSRLATMRDAAASLPAEGEDRAEASPSAPEDERARLGAINAELVALGEVATTLAGAAAAADEQARALAAAAARADFDRDRLVAQLEAAVPGPWEDRLAEEVARQTSPSAQDRARRDASAADALQRDAVRRMEARGDVEVSRASGSLDTEVDVRRSALVRELDAHAMRYAALDRLDALQAETAERVARGEPDSGVRALVAKLVAGAPQRHAERVAHLRRDARQVAALIKRLGKLAARRDRQGRSADAAALRAEISSLEDALDGIEAALARLEGREPADGVDAARAPVDWRVPVPLAWIVPEATDLAASLAASPTSATGAPTASVVAPSGSALGDEVVVSLDPRYLGFDVIGWGAPQGLDPTSSGAPLSPPQITLEDGSACPSPPCCPPGMCAEGEACQCRPRSASRGARTPDGTEPRGPDDPAGADEGGRIGSGLRSGGGGGDGSRTRPGGGGGGGGRFVDDDAAASLRSRAGRGPSDVVTSPSSREPVGSPPEAAVGDAATHGPSDERRERGSTTDGEPTEPTGPAVTVTEDSVRVGPPVTSPLGEGSPLTEADDVEGQADPENPVYRTPSGGLEQQYDTNVANRELALGAAAAAQAKMDEVTERAMEYGDRARRMRDAADAFRDRRRAEDTDAYDGWIEHLDRQHAEAREMERALRGAWVRYREKRDRYVDDAVRFDAAVAPWEPKIERSRAYAKYATSELLLRGLADVAVGLSGVEEVLPVPELLPDGSARSAGGVIGMLLGGSRLVGGATKVATSTLKGVKAVSASKRLAEAARRLKGGASPLKAFKAARAMTTAKDLVRMLESGLPAAEVARRAVRAAKTGSDAIRVSSRVRLVERGAAGVREVFGTSGAGRRSASGFAGTSTVGARAARVGDGMGTLGGSAVGGRVGTGGGIGGVGSESGGLTHLTTPLRRAKIDAEGLLRGTPGKGLYAFEGAPPDSAFLRIVSGVGPSKSAPVLIPEGAAGAFHKPLRIGPWNLIRRLAGVRVAPGSVDLATGMFIPYATGRFSWITRTSEPLFLAADLAIDYTAYKVYKATRGE